jgi:hypothetical protein
MTKEEEWTLDYLKRAVMELQRENERLRALTLSLTRPMVYDAEDLSERDLNEGVDRE